MSSLLTAFDPSASPSGKLTTNLGSDAGTLIVLNDSATNIYFQLEDGSRRLCPAQSWRRYDLPAGNNQITWTQISMLPLSVPESMVFAESYTQAEAACLPDVLPTSFVRAIQGNTSMSSASTFTVTGHDTWNITQDISGDLDFLDTTTGALFSMGRSGILVPPYLNVTNQIGEVGGQTTVGNLGVPVVVGQGIHVAVPTSSATMICSFLPPAAGLYRVSGVFNVSTSGGNLTFGALYYDPDMLSTLEAYFYSWGSGVVYPVELVAHPITAVGSYYCHSQCIYAGTSGAIVIQYQNTAISGLSDMVSGYIERLS